MNQITISSPLQSPAPDQQATDDLAAVRNAVVRDYPAAPEILLVPIPATVRTRLERRRADLERCLASCRKAEHPQIAKVIAEMLGAFGGNSGGSPQAIVAKYLEVLSDLPVWAIVAACKALERGDVDAASLDFRPSAPRVRDTARALLAPWLEEFHQIKRTLEMPALESEDAEMRVRVGELLAGLSAKLKAKRG